MLATMRKPLVATLSVGTIAGALVVTAAILVADRPAAPVAPPSCSSPATMEVVKNLGTTTSVVWSKRTTASAVAAWQEANGKADGFSFVSQLRDLPPATAVTVCVYRGTFHGHHPPSATGTPSSADTLSLILFDDGTVQIYQVGQGNRMHTSLP